jgi:phosphatidylglycerophosphatase A
MQVEGRSQKLEVRSEKGKKQYLKFQIPNSKCKSLLFGICFFFIGISSYAQCAMCRAVLTSEGNTKKAEAVNDGIVFLMAVPYVLVAIIGFIIYRMFRKKK